MRRSAVLVLIGVALGCGDDPLATVAPAGTVGADVAVSVDFGAGSGGADAEPGAGEGGAAALDPRGEDPPGGEVACAVPASGCEDVPSMESRTYPIVLAHGMGGFDQIGPLPYFVGVADALRAAGFATYTAVVDPLNGSDVRAGQLATFVDHVLACTCAPRVNLIGHSQGGIDARVLVNVMGYGDRVASVTTVATPHAGSRVADALLGLDPAGADDLVDLVATLFVDIYTDPLEDASVRAALTWVSTPFLSRFAAEHPDDPQVAWYSYAGRAGLTAKGTPECDDAALPNPEVHTAISAGLLPGWVLLGGLEGVDNDGLVTVESARRGTFRGCVPADHLQEIGLWVGVLPTYDTAIFFLHAAEALEADGY